MRHCPLKCVNNLSKKSGNDIFHSVKDKNRIFTGYQIFVTGEILVFHRYLYNKRIFNRTTCCPILEIIG